MSEKKEAIDAEVTGVTEVKEEKKENAFSRFIKKTKQSVNDTILESKISSSYSKNHKSFSIYTKDELLSRSVDGEIVDGKLIYFGTDEFAKGAVVIGEDDKAYYYVSAKETVVKAVVDGVEYERPGMEAELDSDVTEVNVVKAGKRYFIYKG